MGKSKGRGCCGCLLVLLGFGLCLIVLLACGTIGGAGYWVSVAVPDLGDILRLTYITAYADRMAGEPLPFGGDVLSGPVSCANEQRCKINVGMASNSEWIVTRTIDTLAYFDFEGITTGETVLPDGAFFWQNKQALSFIVAGENIPPFPPDFINLVIINPRYLQDPAWRDEGGALATLVHELVHAQGKMYSSVYWFLQGMQDFGEISREAEGHTQAAMIETLAAMCNFGDAAACRGFWIELRSMSAGSLRAKFAHYNAEGLYTVVANSLWRNSNEIERARKFDRYWSDKQQSRLSIIEKYDNYPLYTFILPGACIGLRMDAGLVVEDEDGNEMQSLVQFDDTAYLLRGVRWAACPLIQ